MGQEHSKEEALLTFHITTPADARFLKAVRAFLCAVLAECTSEEVDMLVLALDEACSNLLKHRASGTEQVDVYLEVDGSRARFRVNDFCSSMDVPKIKPRDLEDVRPGGLGMHFIGEIMDRVEFEADPDDAGRMVLVLEKELTPRSET